MLGWKHILVSVNDRWGFLLGSSNSIPPALAKQAGLFFYQTALPSVVNIQVTQRVQGLSSEPFDFDFLPSPFPFPEMPRTPEEFFRRGEGSGFVWDKEGHIVTNYHVVAGATDVGVRFADGRFGGAGHAGQPGGRGWPAGQ